MTLGDAPLTLGSLYRWQLSLTRDGAPWDLTGLSVLLWWRRPDGTSFSRVPDSAGAGGAVVYDDTATLLDVPGSFWTLAAEVVGVGRTLPVRFEVVRSP